MQDRHSSLPQKAETPKLVWGLDPETRTPISERVSAAFYDERCWSSGDPLGRYKSFLLDVRSALTRTSAVPPSREKCLLEAAAGSYPQISWPSPGLIWTTLSYRARWTNGAAVFLPGEPTSIQWFTPGGGPVTMEDGYEAIKAALEPLVVAVQEGPDRDQDELTRATLLLHRWLPVRRAAP